MISARDTVASVDRRIKAVQSWVQLSKLGIPQGRPVKPSGCDGSETALEQSTERYYCKHGRRLEDFCRRIAHACLGQQTERQQATDV